MGQTDRYCEWLSSMVMTNGSEKIYERYLYLAYSLLSVPDTLPIFIHCRPPPL
jgi:hypothetical protein